ncbi:MAG: ribosome maturation factor RimM [Lysobacteraceae bacterium]|nr:MAG: ribosome maturation factor RimM [Xanthomonadaceae bacterium]
MSDNERRILLGRIVGAFGIRGQIKIESWTEPRDAIFRYQPWILVDAAGNERLFNGARGKESGKHLVANFPGVDDRNVVEAMRGTDIYVARSALPPPRAGEFYWVDLEGFRVVNVDGFDFGTVSHLFSTGANDVLAIRGDKERMVPFVEPDFVKSVDFDAGLITVDWDPDF